MRTAVWSIRYTDSCCRGKKSANAGVIVPVLVDLVDAKAKINASAEAKGWI